MARLLVIPIAMIAMLAGAMVWSGSAAEPRADFAFINTADIYTLDINQMTYTQDFRIMYAIREGLFCYDPKTFRPEPTGCTHFEQSQDKRVWTFHLRPGARWSNNDLVTSADYVFSWRLMLEQPSQYQYLYYYIRNAKDFADARKAGKAYDFAKVGIQAPDPMTLRVTLTDPVPYLPDLLAFPPFYPRNERSMADFADRPDAAGRVSYRTDYTRPALRAGDPGVVTNGMFNLTRWDFRRRLVLEKSATYWDKANVQSNRIEMLVNDNPLSQLLQYETGVVDWLADVKGVTAAELKAAGRTDLHSSPAFGTAFLTLYVGPELPPSVGVPGKNPLADIRVRQALAMSIDRRFITDNITRMDELPARTYLPPDGTLPDFRWLPGPYQPANATTQPYDPAQVRALLPDPAGKAGPGLPYDVAKARKLLAEAGYPGGEGFPSLPLSYNSDNPTRAAVVQALKAQWQQALNINVSVEQIEGKVFKQKVSKKDYAIATSSWYGDYPDASTFTDKYLSSSDQNDALWKNPKFDDLCDRATREPDVVARGKLLSEAESLLDSEVPIVPLYHYVNVTLSRDTLEGVRPNPQNLTMFKPVRVRK